MEDSPRNVIHLGRIDSLINKMAVSNLENVTPNTATNTGNGTTSDMTNVAIDTSTHPVSPNSSSGTSYNSANFKIGCDNTNSGRN